MSSIFSLGSDVSFETIRPMVLVVLVISACALIYALILSTLVNKEDEVYIIPNQYTSFAHTTTDTIINFKTSLT